LEEGSEELWHIWGYYIIWRGPIIDLWFPRRWDIWKMLKNNWRKIDSAKIPKKDNSKVANSSKMLLRSCKKDKYWKQVELKTHSAGTIM
jgi:hypothetical protein